jgi:hypothetical protein
MVNAMTNGIKDVQWLQIDPSELSADNQKLYGLLKDAQQKTAKIRADFEEGVRKQAAAMIPEGHTLAFGYKFGRLSVAAVPAEKPKAAVKNVFKLSK